MRGVRGGEPRCEVLCGAARSNVVLRERFGRKNAQRESAHLRRLRER